VTYYRAIDPFPLESPEQTKLHDFYARLAAGRLSTTQCAGCGRAAWPPRGFCPHCGSDRFDWIDLPSEGTVYAFTVQEAGLPAGFAGPRVFAIVTVADHRIFTVVTGADPTSVRMGQRVRLAPLRVADDANGLERWLPAFQVA
jgi:uncharacterized OB-fold protein